MKCGRAKEGRNIIHTIKQKKAKCIGHILFRNSFIKHVIERNIKGKLEGLRKEEEDVSS